MKRRWLRKKQLVQSFATRIPGASPSFVPARSITKGNLFNQPKPQFSFRCNEHSLYYENHWEDKCEELSTVPGTYERSVQDNTAEKEKEQQGGEGLIQEGLDHGNTTQDNWKPRKRAWLHQKGDGKSSWKWWPSIWNSQSKFLRLHVRWLPNCIGEKLVSLNFSGQQGAPRYRKAASKCPLLSVLCSVNFLLPKVS